MNTAVWSVQFLAREIRVLACDTGADWATGRRVAEMMSRGWAYAGHVLPHDGAARQKGGLTYAEELEKSGLRNVITLPVTKDRRAGINRLRSMLPAMSFDEARCTTGIAALEAYHLEYDNRRKMYKDEPRHDWSSHACDALRYLAEAAATGTVKIGAAEQPSRLISPIEGLGDLWAGGRRRTPSYLSALDM